MADKSTLGGRIKFYRESCDLTQKQLAEALGLECSSISQYERGFAGPRLDTLRRMAAIFCVSVETLLTDDTAPVLHNDDPDFVQTVVNRFSYLTKDEQLLILQFRQITDAQRAEVLQFVHAMFE